MTADEYTSYLRSLGAREFEVVGLQMDQKRGLAAVALAIERGADRPVPYALKMFDDPTWEVEKTKPVLKTNQAAPEVKCHACGGDRFVEITNDPSVLYGESYAPCAVCNSKADTSFWTARSERFVSPAR